MKTITILQYFYLQDERGLKDIYDSFDDFLATHRLVAKLPTPLREGGALSNLVPRTFDAQDVDVPLAATGKILYIMYIVHRHPPILTSMLPKNSRSSCLLQKLLDMFQGAPSSSKRL